MHGEIGEPLISREEMTTAWLHGFRESDPKKGGCPAIAP
jgi:hypothetical protein